MSLMMICIVILWASTLLDATAQKIISKVVIRAGCDASMSSSVDICEGCSRIRTYVDTCPVMSVCIVRADQQTLSKRSISQQIYALIASSYASTDRRVCETIRRTKWYTSIRIPVCEEIGVIRASCYAATSRGIFQEISVASRQTLSKSRMRKSAIRAERNASIVPSVELRNRRTKSWDATKSHWVCFKTSRTYLNAFWACRIDSVEESEHRIYWTARDATFVYSVFVKVVRARKLACSAWVYCEI